MLKNCLLVENFSSNRPNTKMRIWTPNFVLSLHMKKSFRQKDNFSTVWVLNSDGSCSPCPLPWCYCTTSLVLMHILSVQCQCPLSHAYISALPLQLHRRFFSAAAIVWERMDWYNKRNSNNCSVVIGTRSPAAIVCTDCQARERNSHRTDWPTTVQVCSSHARLFSRQHNCSASRMPLWSIGNRTSVNKVKTCNFLLDYNFCVSWWIPTIPVPMDTEIKCSTILT